MDRSPSLALAMTRGRVRVQYEYCYKRLKRLCHEFPRSSAMEIGSGSLGAVTDFCLPRAR